LLPTQLWPEGKRKGGGGVKGLTSTEHGSTSRGSATGRLWRKTKRERCRGVSPFRILCRGLIVERDAFEVLFGREVVAFSRGERKRRLRREKGVRTENMIKKR